MFDKMSESKLTIVLPSNVESSDIQFWSDLISPKNWNQSTHIRKESAELWESAISSMKSNIGEFSRGEKSFLKDLHK